MRRCVGVLVLIFFAGLANAPGTLVDWSTQTWMPGTLNNSFDVDPGNPGNDATVTVSGDTGQLQPAIVSGQQTPAITSNLEGGFGAGHMSLQLALNLANDTQAVTVTIDFSTLYAAGVANVSFKLFDIDFANGGGTTYQDVIRSIVATSTTGTTIAPTITGLGPNVSLSGSGINQVLTGVVSTSDTGATSGNADATINFNTTNIRSITFTYGSSSAFANPTYQHISLDNIDYSIVPESNNWWVGLFGYGVLIVSALSHYRKLRPTKKVRRS